VKIAEMLKETGEIPHGGEEKKKNLFTG